MASLEPAKKSLPSHSLVESALALQEIDDNLYQSTGNLWRPARARGVFGGQVIGQALTAVSRTAPKEGELFSMHALFLRAGDPSRDIVYRVRNLRDGRSFSQRHVTAQQHGRAIFAMMASFQKPEASMLEHQRRAPRAPAPHTVPNEEERYAALLQDPRLPARYKPVVEALRDDMVHAPIEMRRATEISDPFAPKPLSAEQLVWMRTRTPLDADANLHRCALAFASDFLLLGTALRPQAHAGRPVMMASLDHAMYFHAPFRFDEWLLYQIDSPRAHGGRALCHGYVYKQDGTLVVSVTQEGVIRMAPFPHRALGDGTRAARGAAAAAGDDAAAQRAKL